MDLVNFLPEGSLLKRGAFKRWNDNENSTLLTLTVPHSVSAKWGAREVEGRADIKYVFQSSYKTARISDSLETGNFPVIGNQTTDLLRGLVDALRPKMSHNISETSNGAFDLRAVCYVLGATIGSVATGGSVRLEAPCSVRLLSPGWTVPSASEVTVAPGIARTPREFASLLSIMGTAGTKVLQLMSDTVPAISSRVLTGNDLGAYCFRLFAVVLSASQNVGCADHHCLAFFRGMNHSVKLWSHSDEGGWIREPLRMASYPPSCGVISITVDRFIGISTRDSVASGLVPKLFLAHFMKFVGLLVVSDPGGKDLTVLSGSSGPDARPSGVEGLQDSFERCLSSFRRRLCEVFDFHRSGVMDTHSTYRYFHADLVDSHLSGNYIVPFWWVEPSALNTEALGEYPLPAVLGKKVTLPLCSGGSVFKNSMTPEVNGRVFGGCKVIVKQSDPDLRMSGMSYILSGAYNRANGLSRCTYVTRPDLGSFTTDASFVPEGEVNAVQRRWITPHNPMPAPVEGKATHPLTFEYLYSGEGKEPTLGDWASGEVQSGLGLFTVSKHVGVSSPRTHRFVPQHLVAFINSFNQDRALVDIGILSEYIATAPPPPAPKIEIPPSDTPPGELGAQVKVTTLKNTDPSPDYAEEVNVRMDATAGARPDLPKSPPQDESPPGSDLSAPSEREE